MTRNSQVTSLESDGEIAIAGGGIAGCLLAVQLIRETGRIPILRCTRRPPAFEYQVLSDRSTLLDLADRLGLSESCVLQVCRPVHFTYSAWTRRQYAVSDHFFELGGPKFVFPKSALERLARDAARAHGVTICLKVPPSGPTRSLNADIEINALGRAAFKRNGRGGKRSVMINTYLRFVCDLPSSVLQNSEAAHIIEATPSGWLSALPIAPGQIEIIFYSDQHSAATIHVAKRCLLHEICNDSEILSRLTNSGNARVKSVQRGFTVALSHPDKIDSSHISIGDALFPTDPLAGQGLRFAIWSTDLAAALISGRISAKDLSEFNKRVAETAHSYHLQRQSTYRSAFWYRYGSKYWRRQANFSMIAAGKTPQN